VAAREVARVVDKAVDREADRDAAAVWAVVAAVVPGRVENVSAPAAARLLRTGEAYRVLK
jgi:hypothetical protein